MVTTLRLRTLNVYGKDVPGGEVHGVETVFGIKDGSVKKKRGSGCFSGTEEDLQDG